MSQIDKVKGHNTTLRYWLSVVVSLIVLCVGTIISDYRADKMDEITVLAIISTVIGLVLAGVIQAIINQNTQKMEEL
jgi:undecaprenyl pyrophosphate phosphatase UppP